MTQAVGAIEIASQKVDGGVETVAGVPRGDGAVDAGKGGGRVQVRGGTGVERVRAECGEGLREEGEEVGVDVGRNLLRRDVKHFAYSSE